MDLLKFLDERLGEPSTWVAISSLLVAAHINIDPGLWNQITLWGGVMAAGLGVVLAEKGSKPSMQIASDVLAAIVSGIKALPPSNPTPPPSQP